MALTEVISPRVDTQLDAKDRILIRKGLYFAEDMRIFAQSEAPLVKEIEAMIPPAQDFSNPGDADSTESDHGRAHIASVLILAPPFIDLVQKLHPEILIPKQQIIEGASIHDLDANGSSNKAHGLTTVLRFEQSQRDTLYNDRWPLIRFLVEHHSDLPDKQYGQIPVEWKFALDIMCDIDASLLPRRGVSVPVSEIIFRTPEARVFGLVHIATALRLLAGDNSPYRGNVNDFLQAGVRLGLLRDDMITPYV